MRVGERDHLPDKPAKPKRAARRDGRKSRLDSLAGWGISLCIHIGAMLVLTQLFWSGGTGTGEGEGREVGIVAAEESGTFGAEQVGQLRIESPQAIETPQADQITPQQIQRVDASATGQAPEAIVALESGGGAASGTSDWAGFAASGGTAGEGGSFFGLVARGKSFVYVVDKSGSMSGAKWRRAQEELMRSVIALGRAQKFYIIFYDTRAAAMPGGKLVPATAGQRQQAFEWAREIRPFGATNPTEAMKQALALRPDTIWLLSDGLFDDAAVEAIGEANPGRRVKIHTIAFFDDKGEPVLRRIADENGGNYQFVKSE